MSAYCIAEYTLRNRDYPHKYRHMLTKTGVEQLGVDTLQKALRIQNVVAGLAPEVPLQAVGEVLEQHRNKGRTGTVAGHIGDIDQHLVVGNRKVVKKVPAQVQRWLDHVVYLKAKQLPAMLRQHSQLDLAAGILVCPQLGNTIAELLVRVFEFLPVMLVQTVNPYTVKQPHNHIVKGAFIIAAGLEHQDRKSTRLNSSHVRISYAVFCLKKKK